MLRGRENPILFYVGTITVALRASLARENSKGWFGVTEYCSTNVILAVRSYTGSDWELLLRLNGLQRFWCYSKGSESLIQTYNQVVCHLFSKPKLSRRDTRWLETLGDSNINKLSLTSRQFNVLEDAPSGIEHIHIGIIDGLKEGKVHGLFSTVHGNQVFEKTYLAFAGR